MRRMLKFILCSGMLIIGCSLVATAHDGIHEQIVSVTKAIRKAPNNPALYLKRAELYRLHKEWQNSARDFGKARSIDPKLTIVDLGRGKLLLDSGQFAKAKVALEIFLAKEPRSFEGNLTLARIYRQMKDISSSADFFSRAIGISPQDSIEIYLERSDILASVGNFHGALSGLDEGIIILGPISTLVSAAIDLEIKRGNFNYALLRLDSFSAGLQNKESHLLRRAQIQLMAGRRCEARKSLQMSQSLFDALSPSRRNIRAIKEQTAQLNRSLAAIPANVCDLKQ